MLTRYWPQAEPLIRTLHDTTDAVLAWSGANPTRALLLRLACRARAHNRSCWGNPACPRHGRRKR